MRCEAPASLCVGIVYQKLIYDFHPVLNRISYEMLIYLSDTVFVLEYSCEKSFSRYFKSFDQNEDVKYRREGIIFGINAVEADLSHGIVRISWHHFHMLKNPRSCSGPHFPL